MNDVLTAVLAVVVAAGAALVVVEAIHLPVTGLGRSSVDSRRSTSEAINHSQAIKHCKD